MALEQFDLRSCQAANGFVVGPVDILHGGEIYRGKSLGVAN